MPFVGPSPRYFDKLAHITYTNAQSNAGERPQIKEKMEEK
jgi:hypothetical protein